MIRILVTGANGQLGREIQAKKETLKGAEFYFTDIDELDITDRKEVKSIISEIKPAYLINCAAYTAVDRAEEDADNAYAVNATAVENIVKAASNVPWMKLIHISTDFVFDGKSRSPYKEDSSPAPQSVYGKSKQRGEEFALSYPRSIIIRTSWLYSEYGGNFVKTVLRLAGERDEIKVVNDQTGTPTWASDLASALLGIVDQTVKDGNKYHAGIYHYSNEGQCTWYEFAGEIKRLKGLGIIINPVSTAEFPLPAKRPGYSVLCLDKIKNTYNIEIPSWQNSLENCLTRINQ
jgi:dTDP-4-dehydrorhamnose reductase